MAPRLFPCFLLLAVGLCACVPLPDTYHGVSAPEGTVAGGCVHGEERTPSELRLDRGQVRVSIDASDVSSLIWNDGLLSIDFKVPVGSSVSLDWSQLGAVDRETGKPMAFEISDTYLPESLTKKPTTGKFEPASDSQIGFIPRPGDVVDYQVPVQFRGKIPDSFTLRLPPMTIDRTAYPALDVLLQKKVGVACIQVPAVQLIH